MTIQGYIRAKGEGVQDVGLRFRDLLEISQTTGPLGMLGGSDVALVWKEGRAFSAWSVGFRAEGLKELKG